MTTVPPSSDLLIEEIRQQAERLGLTGFGVSGCDLGVHEEALQQWCDAGHHGEMEYMVRHGTKRSRPQQLLPGTRSILSFRLDYLSADTTDALDILATPTRGYISRYALGRDYHKLFRNRLARLAKWLQQRIGPFGHRVFVDSAPVLEKGIAEQAGLGWIGKHTNLLHRQHGSWFFLGEIYTDLPLPPDRPQNNHCGNCSRCIEVCPTAAIIAPYRLDARRCISYLTIEHPGEIPLPLRQKIGNRIFGCDDCQLHCPWNRFARHSDEPDFTPRHNLDAPELTQLLQWNEETFLERMAGSPIRRIGYSRWQRNLAVALGNSGTPATIPILQQQLASAPELARPHLEWAIERLQG